MKLFFFWECTQHYYVLVMKAVSLYLAKIFNSLIYWRRSGHWGLLAMPVVALHEIIWRHIITALGQNGARSQLNTDYARSLLLFIKSQLPDSLWQGGLPWSKYVPVTSVRDLNKSCSALLKLDCHSMLRNDLPIHKNHRQCIIDYWRAKCTCHSN